MHLTRAQFCALTGMNENVLDLRASRGLLPDLFPDPERKRGSYAPIQALIALIASNFTDTHHTSVAHAAEVVREAACISTRMKDIALTSEHCGQGEPPKADIFYAYIVASSTTDARPTTTSMCGSLAQIAKAFPRAIKIELVNVTLSAGELRARAVRNDIDLTEFWKSWSRKNVA